MADSPAANADPAGVPGSTPPAVPQLSVTGAIPG
jgi:hypothetical protein